jgi:hypothetical protein
VRARIAAIGPVVPLAVALIMPAGCAGTSSRWAGPPPPVAATGSVSPSAAATGARPSPTATLTATPAGCPVLPADNISHADVSRLAVHPRSAAYVASMGPGKPVHPDFGSGLIDGAPFGIPVTTIRSDQKRVPVSFEYADESDPGPYPVPPDARIEGGPNADGDRHVILHDPTGCRLYELYDAHPAGAGWRAGSGAVYDLRSNRLRAAGATSADAAGLPILPGLVRFDEVRSGRVDHAIRLTTNRTRNAYVWPARHAASTATDANLPPMGLRLRLKAGVDTSRLPAQARVVADALKRHGAILADNGSPWFLSGTQDDRWDNDALNALKSLRGADFEAVDTTGLMVDPASGAVRR